MHGDLEQVWKQLATKHVLTPMSEVVLFLRQVVLAGWGLPSLIRMALNSQKPTCLHFPSTRIKGMCHHLGLNISFLKNEIRDMVLSQYLVALLIRAGKDLKPISRDAPLFSHVEHCVAVPGTGGEALDWPSLTLIEKCAKRGLPQQLGCLLPLRRTRVWFLARTSGGSQTPVTTAPGDTLDTHTDTQVRIELQIKKYIFT